MQVKLAAWKREFEEFMILKNHSKATIKTYNNALKAFLAYYCVNHESQPMTFNIARGYILEKHKSGFSWRTINIIYSAIRKFFTQVLLEPWEMQKLPRPRQEKQLPHILSKEEIVQIIEHATSLKGQMLLLLIYITGMRLSEVMHLKIVDIDSHRLQIRVNKGKGNKDRMIHIPQILIDLLRVYYMYYRPEIYLFTGSMRAHCMPARSIQHALAAAKRAAGIQKKCSIHTLRHCYATHHLENGTDLVYLKEQMGHINLKTTAQYIRLCVERKRYIQHPIQSMPMQLHQGLVLVSCSETMEKPIFKNIGLACNISS